MHWRCSTHHCLWKMANSSIPFCLHQILKELCCFYIWGFFPLSVYSPNLFILLQHEKASVILLGFVSAFSLWLCIVGRYGLRRCCTPCHTSVTWHSHRLCFSSMWDQRQNLHMQLSAYYSPYTWSDWVERAILGSRLSPHYLYLETLYIYGSWIWKQNSATYKLRVLRQRPCTLWECGDDQER